MATVTERKLVRNQDGSVSVVTYTTEVDDAVITRQQNEQTLRQRADAALAANATYLALTSPTAAQNTAQIQRLTRECNTLIRFLLQSFDDIIGT